MTEPIIAGAGSSTGGRAAVEAPDTLRSRAVLSVLDLLGEGKIGGLINDKQSIFINDVPLQNADGSFNFNGTEVSGPTLGEQEQEAFAEFSDIESPTSHGVVLRQATPFVFNVNNPNADQVRVVMTLPALAITNPENGDVNGTSVEYRFEVATRVGGVMGPYQGILAGESWIDGGTGTLDAPLIARAVPLSGPEYGGAGMSVSVRAAGPWAEHLNFRTTLITEYWNGSTWIRYGNAQELRVDWRTRFNNPEPVNDLFTNEVWFESPRTFPQFRVRELQTVLEGTYDETFDIYEHLSFQIGRVRTRRPAPTVVISGKSRNRYQRNHILTLPKPGTEWNIRVTRVTPDSASSLLSNDTVIDSTAEITKLKLSYPNSAVVGLALDSVYFNSVPRRSYLVSGLYVKVPSNFSYDPITNARTYTGVWDGTFTNVDTSDNPAWILYDLLTSERYGLGQYIKPEQINKAKLYEIARYCDEMVPNGLGGTEPRFAINVAIQNRVEAYNLIVELCAVFRGMTFWTGGAADFMQDSPRDADMIYSHANIIGDFEYAGTARKDRHSVILVGWNDPDERFKRKVEYVEDQELIQKYGVRSTRLETFGCTSRGQATRAGRWALLTERYETDVISFNVGLDSALVLPGEIVKIHDRFRAGKKMGGRIISCTSTSAVIDAPVTAGPGASVSLRLPDGSLVDRDLTSGPGATTTLTWATPLTTLPLANAMFVVTEPALEPQHARVISIAPVRGKVAEFTINALVHNPSKYAAIEQGLQLELPQISIINLDQLEAPTELEVTESAYEAAPGVLGNRLTVSWQGLGGRFELRWRMVEPTVTNWNSVFLTTNTFDIDGVVAGVYEFQVIATNALLGGISAPATLTYTVEGGVDAPPNVTGLAYLVTDAGFQVSWAQPQIPNWNGTEIRRGTVWAASPTVFSGRATSFVWPFQLAGTYSFIGRHEILGGLLSDIETTFSVTILNPSTPTIASPEVNQGTAQFRWANARTTQPLSHYEIRVGTTSSTWATATYVKNASSSATADALVFTSNGTRRVFIQAVDVAGNASPVAQQDFTITLGDSLDLTAPPVLSGFSASAGFVSTTLIWTPSTYTEGGGPGSTNVYGADWPTGAPQPAFSAAALLDRMPTGVGFFTEVIGTSRRRIYWLKNCTRAGVEQATPTGPQNVTTTTIQGVDLSNLVIDASKLADGSVTATKLANGAVGLTKFASGIEPITNVSSLPASLVTRTIFNTTDGKLYRWNGSAYVANVPTSDLTGQITNGQVSDSAITAVKLANGAVTAAKTAIAAVDPSSGNLAVNSVTTNNIAAGAVAAGKIAADAVGANEIAAGAVTASKLAVIVGGGNLAANSSFEAALPGNRPRGYTPYNNAGVAVTVLRIPGRMGGFAYGLRADAPTSSTFGLYGNNVTDTADAGGVVGGWLAGKTYVVSFYAMKANGAAMSNMVLRWDINPTSTVAVSNPSLSTSWQRYVFRITWGGSVQAMGGVHMDVVGIKAAGDIIYLDDLQIEEGDVATAYAPRTVELLPGTIIAEHLSAGSVTASAIQAGAVNASHIAADSITAGQIAAGAISASELAAGAVTTDKLLVTGRGRAINDDPGCVDQSAWSVGSGAAISFLTDSSAPFGARIIRTSGPTQFSSRSFPIAGGTRYKVATYARQTTGGGGVFYLRLYCYNAAGALLTYIVTATSPAIGDFEGVTVPAGWTKYAGYINVPAAAVTGAIVIHSNWSSSSGFCDFADIRAEEYVGADLIVDGAVQASHLAANSIAVGTAAIQNGAINNAMIANATIEAAKINSVDAGTITTGLLNAARIAAGSLNADRITAGTINTDRLVIGSVTANVAANLGAGLSGSFSFAGSVMSHTSVPLLTVTKQSGYVVITGYMSVLVRPAVGFTGDCAQGGYMTPVVTPDPGAPAVSTTGVIKFARIASSGSNQFMGQLVVPVCIVIPASAANTTYTISTPSVNYVATTAAGLAANFPAGSVASVSYSLSAVECKV